MSLDLGQSLAALAAGQAILVAPSLGESYTGKTAGSIAFLLFLLANDLEGRIARRADHRARIESLLADAPPAARADPLVSAALEQAAAPAGAPQPFDRLMGALAALHAWADANDRETAARCRRVLLDWATAERLDIPLLPG